MELSNKALAFIAEALRAQRESFAAGAEDESLDDDARADFANDAAFVAAILEDVEAEIGRRRERMG